MKKLFLDSANIDHIKEMKWLIDGVTTNSSMKITLDQAKLILESLDDTQELHLQINSKNYEDIINEATRLFNIAPNIVVKLPVNNGALEACKYVKTNMQRKINMTLCFSQSQLYLCDKVNSDYASIFIGRMLENNLDISNVLSASYTNILAASIRTTEIFQKVLKYSVNHFTLPYDVLINLHRNDLTEQGFHKFNQ